MKRRKALITFIVVFAVAVFALGMFGVLANVFKGEQEFSQIYSLYFLDTTQTKLVLEERGADLPYGEDSIQPLVEMLIEGPQNTVDHTNAIPHGTTVLSVTSDNEYVTIDFSKEFYGETTAADMLAAFTIVNTVCSRPDAGKVIITVEGKNLIDPNKIEFGALGKDDIEYEGAKSNENIIYLRLYFASQKEEMLIGEYRSVSLKNKEPHAKLAILALMRGPENSTAMGLIPHEAKLKDVKINDSVCFVNFSRDFLDRRVQGEAAEKLCIYSIVNTLTEIDGIHKVQFLIDGQRVESFGSVAINESLERNSELISE